LREASGPDETTPVCKLSPRARLPQRIQPGWPGRLESVF